MVVKNPSDFVGDVLGASEKLTRGILAASVGKVLVIDEAYGLHAGGAHGSTDIYKMAVIDTIVAQVQSIPGDDRCVLLLGYADQMEQMFQSVNPGLSRRFPMASAFVFEDFEGYELRQIFDKKLEDQGFAATDQAKKVAKEMLDRARNRPNFGNAGEIDILLDTAKSRHQSRLTRGEAKSANVLEALDFDPDFDRADRSETNVKLLFEGTVATEGIVRKLEGYQETVRITRSLDLDPKEAIPFNFLFRGPPGTGKTTTARKMGKVFYDMGFLAKANVVECSASDLIAGYVGQTGDKVRKLLDKALGSVLFVDEAYRLADGSFAKEAVDELTDSTTKTRYAKKLVIILAGYEQDINRLLSTNPGLTSRFPEVVDFRSLTPSECVALLQQNLQKQKTSIEKKNASVVLDVTSLENPSEEFRETMEKRFSVLSNQANWASARDVGTLAGSVFDKALKSRSQDTQGQLLVTEGFVKMELDSMLQERQGRSESVNPLASVSDLLAASAPPPEAPLQNLAVRTASKANELTENPPPAEPESLPGIKEKPDGMNERKDAQRDADVSDEVWEQLQKDKQAEREKEEEFLQLQKAARAASDEARDKILRRLLEEERRRKEEEEMRKKLEIMGACPMGYHWIRQEGGYRCAGGSHFVGDGQLAG